MRWLIATFVLLALLFGFLALPMHLEFERDGLRVVFAGDTVGVGERMKGAAFYWALRAGVDPDRLFSIANSGVLGENTWMSRGWNSSDWRTANPEIWLCVHPVRLHGGISP